MGSCARSTPVDPGPGYTPAVERNLLQELKVGVFVLFFLVAIVASVFILSGGAQAFAKEYTLRTTFKDVKGLKTGAVVRLAGIDVGQVSAVEFSADQGKKEIDVELTIRTDYQERIRADSVASISSIGLLGDMYITLTVGNPDQPQLADEGHITSSESVDFLAYADKATSIVENAASISKKVDLMLGSDDAASKAGVSDSLSHVEAMLAEAKDGKGVLHTLIYDEGTARTVKNMVQNADGIVADVKAITGEVRTGNGLAHALIYSDDGEKLTRKLGDAADALDGLMTDLKSGDSLAHALLYDPGKAALMDDLQASVANINGVTAAVNGGEGTLGLLVRDPQLYEDMRVLMGGAQRNALLRAYIRATVARGREETAGSWTGPGAPK